MIYNAIMKHGFIGTWTIGATFGTSTICVSSTFLRKNDLRIVHGNPQKRICEIMGAHLFSSSVHGNSHHNFQQNPIVGEEYFGRHSMTVSSLRAC